jgi:glycosyltransferase involved in cell wall biosynthesis
MLFSIIVPVFDRPNEIRELLESLSVQDYKEKFEILIIEDGSTITCEQIVDSYKNKLNIFYYLKYNSGPGDSRNFGMNLAKGDYFILFDSDCIIPPNYLSEVSKSLNSDFVDFYGGPDKADKLFSNTQKAINFAMTSFLTTGGIRGGSEKISKFEPRSFNMGISKKAFLDSKGFSNIHPGEDPDLSIRLWDLGFKSKLISEAFVYHKRRIDWDKFSLQVKKFGKARPILNSWHPNFAKITYFLPSFFVIGFFLALLLSIFLYDIFLKIYFVYFVFIFIVSSVQNKNIIVGFLSVIAVWKQFFGYGFGFIESLVKIKLLKQKPEVAFPELFFKI